MKKLQIYFWLLLLATMTSHAQPDSFPRLVGPYLGQKPPGTEPEIFAPGVISTRDLIELNSTWSPDMKEFYFARSQTMESEWTANFSIWFTQELNGEWTEPRMAPFSGVYRDVYPSISRDGSHMIFYRMSNENIKTRKGSWIAKRTGNGWDEPQFFLDAYCLNTNDFKTFYFTTEKDDAGNNDLGVFTYSNGEIVGMKNIESDLNSEGDEGHGVISPDGDYLLFDRSSGNSFVSFRQEDGIWGSAWDLNAQYFMPSLSPDGKYIFFTRDRDIYWVSTDIIERLRVEDLARD